MTVFQWMRRYGVFIFLFPVVVYWADAFLTAWHHHGTESVRAIVWENFFSDAGGFAIAFLWVRIVKPLMQRKLYHCTCPHCGFHWVCDPHHIPTQCPHCSKLDSTAAAQ